MRHTRGKFAFTLIELLVVIAIIGLLVSILVPSLGKAKQLANKVRCQTQLNGIAKAHIVYAESYDGFLPGWIGIVDPWNDDMPHGARPARNWPDPVWACLPTMYGRLGVEQFVAEPNVWLDPGVTKSEPYWFYPDVTPDPDYNEYTYHYSYNDRILLNRSRDRMMPGTWEWNVADSHGPPTAGQYGERKISSFPEPSYAILLSEENTGMFDYPDDWAGDKQVLNDPRFTNDDVTEPRHVGVSACAYMDGHAGEIPAGVNLYKGADGTTNLTEENVEYWPVQPNDFD